MSNITLVGTQAVHIAAAREPYQLEVYNNGTSGTVYVSRNAGVSPTNSDYALSPNGKATFLPGVDVYVCTDDGKLASVFYHSDGTAVDLGQVSINGPIALANYPVLLESITLNMAAGQTVGSIDTVIDLTGYSSLLVAMDCVTNTIALTDYVSCVIRQGFNISVTPGRSDDECQWGYKSTHSPGSTATFQVPVKAQYAYVRFTLTRGVGYAADTLSFNLYGSGEVLARKQYVNNMGDDYNQLVTNGLVMFSQGASAQISNPTASKNNNYFMSANPANSSAIVIAARVNGTQYNITQEVFSSPSNIIPVPFSLPCYPLNIITITSASGSASFSVTESS